jgi:signal transduction histidine kinase
VEQLRQMLDQATKLTRTLSTELSPAVLETDRLGVVIEWLASQKRELYGLEVEVEGDADVGDPALRTLLYHLVREALFNVAKHAGTDRARVTLTDTDGHVGVSIQDEGEGFDVATLHEEAVAGFGLASIRERLELIGGRLAVESAPGAGTRVNLTIPRTPQPAS